jgi:hypothetical protein
VWTELSLGFFISTVQALALWAFLPRGVVLTRVMRLQDLAGRPSHNTWAVQNNSSLAVQILSAKVVGVGTYDDDQGKFLKVDLDGVDGTGTQGVEMSFDDEVLEISRVDRDAPAWAGQLVPPGDTLQVKVPNNTSLTIRYRRAGPLGIFERRAVTIDGGV